MSGRGRLVTIIAGVGAAAAILAAGDFPLAQPPRAEPPATAPIADRFVMHSDRVGRDYLIEVTPPAQPTPPGGKVAVVYALDAGYHVAAPEGRALQASGEMAPAFVVAIGYPPGEPNARETDLLYHPLREHGVEQGGGGAAFAAFILDELRPAIEARYPVDPRRAILLGHSLAGLFVANLLAERPRAFSAYLMASPSIWADPRALAGIRAAAPHGNGRLAFITVGGAETPRMRQGVGALSAILGHPPSTFVLRSQIFPGQTHMSYYPAFLAVALPGVLPGAAAK